MPTPTTQIGQQCVATHQKGTSLRYPRNKGGSPTGVKQPPTLETMKIKKTTWCPVSRYLFMRNHGRMSSIEAPVVPSRFEIKAPVRRNNTLTAGVDSPFTVIWIPPEIINKEPMRQMKLTYSIPVCSARSCACRPT